MKKILLFILILSTLSGCKNQSSPLEQERDFSDRAYSISEGMTYDEVVEIMGTEPETIGKANDDINNKKEAVIKDFKTLAYNFLHLEEESRDTYGRTKEQIEYYLPGYDYIDDVISDYYDRRLNREFDSLGNYRATVLKEGHEENWKRAAEFVLWKFPSWQRKEGNISVTFEDDLTRTVSNYISMYSTYDNNGYQCIWKNYDLRGSGVTHVMVYFNFNNVVVNVSRPQRIVN